MSSHHFVRENQEPAVVLHNLESYPYEHLANLLEWAPKVICVEPVLVRAQALGIKIDVLIGGEESKLEELLLEQSPIDHIPSNHLIEDSLKYLETMNAIGAYFITSSANSSSVLRSLSDNALDFDLEVLDERSRNMLCRKIEWKKWLSGSGQYHVTPLIDNTQITTSGFSEDYSGELTAKKELKYDQEGFLSIRSSQVPILISEIY